MTVERKAEDCQGGSGGQNVCDDDSGCAGVTPSRMLVSRMGFWGCAGRNVTDGIAGMEGSDWREWPAGMRIGTQGAGNRAISVGAKILQQGQGALYQ